MQYISICSSLSLQSVFNGMSLIVGAADLQEVKLICSRAKSISGCGWLFFYWYYIVVIYFNSFHSVCILIYYYRSYVDLFDLKNDIVQKVYTKNEYIHPHTHFEIEPQRILVCILKLLIFCVALHFPVWTIILPLFTYCSSLHTSATIKNLWKRRHIRWIQK